jgi:hypothetical protein
MAGSKKSKLGDIVAVTVDPRSNNGSDMAAGMVSQVLDTEDDRVNLRVFLDGDGVSLLRNVPVLSKEPDEDDEDVPTVFALRP